MEDVISGLVALVVVIRDLHINSIAVPALGSGLGGQEWATVKPLIVEALSDASRAHIVIFDPLPQAARL
jgi:O-acetyl-ADP-ribose deacetylase (regulator of RNase III)